MRRAADEGAARIAARRLAAQQLAAHRFARPGQLVAFMGAVQAQDPAAARWAVGLRLGGRGGLAAVERALTDGSIIRTHVMRWTWQLVAPADLHWMVPLVAARLVARAARRHRELGLDAAAFQRAHAAFARALRDGGHLTRAELGAALRAAGLAPEGGRLSHLLGHAELAGLICSGAPRGKQATFALVAARAPRPGSPAPRSRADAAAELARRYFVSRGPATTADFAWWSGLAPAEARTGLEAVRAELAAETVGDAVYWCGARAARLPDAALARAHLLPAFDEYLVAYRDRSAVLADADVRRVNAGGGLLAPAIVVGGRVAGIWRRTFERRGSVTIALQPFAPPDRRARDAIGEAAERYGAFLDLAPNVVWHR
ncbi:MAG TPA: winged helix DNA-binding domain-containing protein [Polyangia bacterium]|nr:winged helix DNA-binding domain-containing protein [Polyangia bacterium]